MKVLFINTVFGRGSTGRIITELGNSVEGIGGEYKVAYGRGCSSDIHSVKIGSKRDVIFHAAVSRITDRAGFYSSFATLKLIEYIKSYQPDIIHLHNLHGYYLNIQKLFNFLKNEFKGKIIWTFHDCWAFTGHCSHYTSVRCIKWQTGCYACPQKKKYPTSWFVDSSKKNYLDKKNLFTGLKNMSIVTVSDWLKNETKQSFFNEYEIKRIYNGVDYKKFRPINSDKRKQNCFYNKRIILSVSDGWSESKGLNRILDVAEVAPADWVFLVVGLNGEQIKKLPSNIIGMERTGDQQELIELYSLADVFFNPSIEETFGLVTAEAMACGTPAVVLDSTACPELIRNSTCGSVIPVNSNAKFTVKTLKAVMNNSCPPVDLDIFDLNRFCQNYLDLYRQSMRRTK